MIDTYDLLSAICQYIDSDIKLRDLQADENSDHRDIIQAWVNRDLAIKTYKKFCEIYFKPND